MGTSIIVGTTHIGTRIRMNLGKYLYGHMESRCLTLGLVVALGDPHAEFGTPVSSSQISSLPLIDTQLALRVPHRTRTCHPKNDTVTQRHTCHASVIPQAAPAHAHTHTHKLFVRSGTAGR